MGLRLGRIRHRCGRHAGNDGGGALFAGEQGHGTENFIFLYVTDLDALNEGFGVTLGDDEYVISLIPLANQLRSRGKVLEPGDRPDFGLLGVCQCIRHQGGLTQHILGELLLTAAVSVNVPEQGFAVVGNQSQRFFAQIGAGRRIQALTQADEVTLLDVEQWLPIYQCVQQTAFEQIKLSSADVIVKVVYRTQFNRFTAGLKPLKQKFRYALKRGNELLGVGWLITYQIHG